MINYSLITVQYLYSVNTKVIKNFKFKLNLGQQIALELDKKYEEYKKLH